MDTREKICPFFSVRALHLVCLRLLLVFNLQQINNPQKCLFGCCGLFLENKIATTKE
jgi:hypothetical protein